MSIFDYYHDITLGADQKEALTLLEGFLLDKGQVFILKGYAGSGKTTILKGLVDFLQSQKRQVDIVAPTGKAAKVLRDKKLNGVTIHRGIYNFEKIDTLEVNNEDYAEKSYHFNFPIAENPDINRVVIVDEASMVSNTKTQHELFTFGTGKLLDDLLTYARIRTTNNKIIFVGDPAQLPPVTDSHSLALDSGFFSSAGLKVQEAALTEVFRQTGNEGNINLILANAVKIRELLDSKQRAQLKFEFDEQQFVNIPEMLGPSTYVEKYPVPQAENGVIIVYSNRQAYSNNVAIREKLFPHKSCITKGDIIILNNNNYSTYGVDLYNGDLAEVLEVSSTTENQAAPVYVTLGTKKVRKNVTLTFRDIVIKLSRHPEVIKCKIIDSFLNSHSAGLSISEMKALYINFVMRFNEQQKARKQQGLTVIKEGSMEFKMALVADPYFNALRAKYGYSITCHKAQGSEWDTVFVDFQGRVGLNNDSLRWAYTAITRARNTCCTIHAPNFDALDKISFSPLKKVTKYPEEAFRYPENLLTPFHGLKAHPCKKLKYESVTETLKDTPYEILRVDSKEFSEDYYLELNDTELRLQGHHNSSGIFSPFRVVSGSKAHDEEILRIFNSPVSFNYPINYVPTSDSFEKLYTRISAATIELDIQVINIVEHRKDYYVNYYLQSGNNLGYIQFYFDSSYRFKTANPMVYNSESFPELVSLISSFTENVN